MSHFYTADTWQWASSLRILCSLCTRDMTDCHNNEELSAHLYLRQLVIKKNPDRNQWRRRDLLQVRSHFRHLTVKPNWKMAPRLPVWPVQPLMLCQLSREEKSCWSSSVRTEVTVEEAGEKSWGKEVRWWQRCHFARLVNDDSRLSTLMLMSQICFKWHGGVESWK